MAEAIGISITLEEDGFKIQSSFGNLETAAILAQGASNIVRQAAEDVETEVASTEEEA